MFQHIDRTLARVRFNTVEVFIECYLQEDNLAPHLYTVVEQHEKGNNAHTLKHFDDFDEACTAYEAAAERVRVHIHQALEVEFHDNALTGA